MPGSLVHGQPQPIHPKPNRRPGIRYEITAPNAGGGTAVPTVVAVADFNNDSYHDFATVNEYGNYTVYLNTPAAAMWPNSLNFGNLQLGKVSAAKTASLYSSGIAPLTPKVTISLAGYTATADGSNCRAHFVSNGFSGRGQDDLQRRENCGGQDRKGWSQSPHL